jgi:Tfp pilus assembly protein PilX
MMTLNRKRSSQDHQRGIALLMALIALLIIGAITAGAILVSNTETNISSNFRDEQLAFFSAKAGIEEARDRMQAGVINTLRTASLPTTLPGTTGSVLYILNPANGETVAPWNGTVICQACLVATLGALRRRQAAFMRLRQSFPGSGCG